MRGREAGQEGGCWLGLGVISMESWERKRSGARAQLGTGKTGYLSRRRGVELGGGKLGRMGRWDPEWVYPDCRGRSPELVEGDGSGLG